VDEECSDDENCEDGRCERPGRSVRAPSDCGLEGLYFAVDSFTLTSTQKKMLDDLAECLRTHAERVVFVEGHTDARGTDAYNIALSEQRAQTVFVYLTEVGIAAERLRVIPKGETESKGDNQTGWHQDRRVVFQWQ